MGSGGFWRLLVERGALRREFRHLQVGSGGVLVGFWWVLAGSGGFWWVLVGSGGFGWVLVVTHRLALRDHILAACYPTLVPRLVLEPC